MSDGEDTQTDSNVSITDNTAELNLLGTYSKHACLDFTVHCTAADVWTDLMGIESTQKSSMSEQNTFPYTNTFLSVEKTNWKVLK